MKIFTSKHSLGEHLATLRNTAKTIGFVPTMGALHQGHLSLLAIAQEQTDVVVCSIFVNPTQFNDPKDLEKYPRPIESDIEKLKQAGCDILFNPGVSEMYAANEQWHLELGELENLLEGKFRPGHYQGVTQVVYKLFDIVQPDVAFFGQKDYQQFMVIKKMVDMLKLPVRLVMCPIMREPDGLAMSSRNIHLSPEERKHALVLSKALHWLAANFEPVKISLLIKHCKEMIENEPEVELEYFEAVEPETMHPVKNNSDDLVVLIAARVGHTRLIDNIILK